MRKGSSLLFDMTLEGGVSLPTRRVFQPALARAGINRVIETRETKRVRAGRGPDGREGLPAARADVSVERPPSHVRIAASDGRRRAGHDSRPSRPHHDTD